MAEFPALPLFTDAYLGDTTHLTTTEHGAYLLLLMVAWRSRDCCLPDDDRLLARYTKCTAGQWKRLRPILVEFFIVENGSWRQRRLTDEAAHVRQLRKSQSDKGRTSALKRKGRHSTAVEIRLNRTSTPTPTPTSTLAKANDADADFVDPEKVMFDQGVRYLGAHGYSEAKARSILGKWKRDHGSPAVIEALGAAQREGAIEPVSFIEGRWRTARRVHADAGGMPLV